MCLASSLAEFNYKFTSPVNWGGRHLIIFLVHANFRRLSFPETIPNVISHAFVSGEMNAQITSSSYTAGLHLQPFIVSFLSLR